jgi:signal transduction histidine kinase/DNA-binding response OmpR family regulator/HPt (histidine-containing phosphotransfer) domain-containing protein
MSTKNELDRIKSLYSYHILDTEREEDYDTITKLAAIICDTPISVVSLVDKQRVWFKSSIGLNIPEVPREGSICDKVIQQNDFYEITDITENECFKINQFVTGSPFLKFYAAVPLRTPSGKNIGVLCVEDIKPRKLTDDQILALTTLTRQVMITMELRLKNMELERLSKAKGDFLSNMSHEIRTPMNAICGFADLLLQTKMSNEQSDMVRIIKASGDILVTIIDDILDYSKIESGKFTFDSKAFDLKSLVNGIHQLLGVKCNDKGLRFNIDKIGILPEYIIGDKVRLIQILTNLIGNAIKFTEHGSVSLVLGLIKQNKEDCVIKFSVIDTGIGIFEDKIKKIFERYEQAENDTTAKYGGTGLGLSISKSLVELQGSNIEVKSEINKGSTFSFILKFGMPSADETKELINSATIKGKTSKPDLEGMKILLAEDTYINKTLIMKILEGTNCTLDWVENGKFCLEKLKSKTYDLILMDLHMPVMNGYEATNAIRKSLNIPIPIIALTASACSKERDKCLLAGMNEYLTKPFKFEELYANIIKFKRTSCKQERENCKLNSNSSSIRYKTSSSACNSPIKEKISILNPQLHNINNDKNIDSNNFVTLEYINKSNDHLEDSNLSTLKEMIDNDEELMKCMVDQYIKDFPTYLKSMLENIGSNSFVEISSTAHKMKCALAMLGMNKTRDMIVEIESLANCISEYMKNINDRFEKSRVNIEKSLADLSLIKLETY